MKILKVLLQKTMLINLLLGVSSGLPLALVGKTLQAWFTDANVGLSVVGLFSLVGLPYSLKFLWAPTFDRFTLPFLGRRRGWLLVLQIALIGAIVLLGSTPPNGELPLSARLPEGIVGFLAWLHAKLPESHLSLSIIGACFLVSFLSASQDIVVDAFRRESLTDEELGMGATVYVYGYRIAMYLSGGAVFFVADLISWPFVYFSVAALVGVGVFATLWAEEPEVHGQLPRNLHESVVLPLKEFFGRQGVITALTVLAFILFYKVGDTMAGNMAIPLYKGLGFSNIEIGEIAKTFGLLSALVGGFIGGAVILKVGIKRALIIGGVLQAVSTAGFAMLASVGHSMAGLAAVVAFEDITGAMGTAAFVAFMAAQTDKRFTATQYALLTSLMSVPRIVLAAPTGIMAERMGWQPFFIFCTVAAVPGLLLLVYMLNSKKFSTLS
jgi:PAT family beta-lactamase induction signal transducer AmpG